MLLGRAQKDRGKEREASPFSCRSDGVRDNRLKIDLLDGHGKSIPYLV
jgi:hypothetical protein